MNKMLAVSVIAMVFSVGAAVAPVSGYRLVTPSQVYAEVIEEGVISADGFGVMPADKSASQAKLLARRAAIVDAQRNLVEIIQGVAVDAETAVSDMMTGSDVVRTKVSGLLKGAKIISEGVQADGTYMVTMEVDKFGASSLASVVMEQKAPVHPVAVVEPSRKEVKNYEKANVGNPQVGTYTGLVIDARGMDLAPTFCPNIFDTNGRGIYGVENVDRDYAANNGIVEYAVGNARWSEVESGRSRAGSIPLIVKAVEVKAAHVNKCDVVISVEDANKILVENQRSGFMNRYAVVFEK